MNRSKIVARGVMPMSTIVKRINTWKIHVQPMGFRTLELGEQGEKLEPKKLALSYKIPMTSFCFLFRICLKLYGMENELTLQNKFYESNF